MVIHYYNDILSDRVDYDDSRTTDARVPIINKNVIIHIGAYEYRNNK